MCITSSHWVPSQAAVMAYSKKIASVKSTACIRSTTSKTVSPTRTPLRSLPKIASAVSIEQIQCSGNLFIFHKYIIEFFEFNDLN